MRPKKTSLGAGCGKSRRGFLKGSVGLVAGGAAAQLMPGCVAAPQSSAALLNSLQNLDGRAILLKDGIIMSMDRQVGDFDRADLLIQGKKIVSVGPNLQAPGNALVVNAERMVVMPGFVDTHHHQYETVLRSVLANGMILTAAPRGPKNNYGSVIQGIFTPLYTPDDARIAEVVSSLSQISAGVTTTIDTSQVQLTPEHTDACIAGLKESGRRAVFAYGANGQNAAEKFPVEIARLRKQYFSSDDQLLTLAANLTLNRDQFKIARSLGAPIVSHFWGPAARGNPNFELFAKEGLLGPDNEYIHFTQQPESRWKIVADTGGRISIATPIEMQMRHGHPPFQECLDRGIRPSLSVDVECNMTADSFTQMRCAFTWQRAMINERSIQGEENLPPLVTCRDVIEFATVNGARDAHLDSKIGTLTPGKEADIIMLATNRVNVYPLNNVPGAIVTLMDTTNVENVFIAGKVMKWQGQLVSVDLDRIGRQIETACDALLARAKYPRDLWGTCCPGPDVPLL